MIATLRGEIAQVEENALILEVGGVGLRVFVPAPLRGRMKAGEVILLYTHLVVREDALILYGFESQSERELFNVLLGVDGVGPKVALSVLSSMTMDALASMAAMTDRDSEVLAALTALGYSVVEAQAAIQALPRDAPEDTEERLRMALQYFQ